MCESFNSKSALNKQCLVSTHKNALWSIAWSQLYSNKINKFDRTNLSLTSPTELLSTAKSAFYYFSQYLRSQFGLIRFNAIRFQVYWRFHFASYRIDSFQLVALAYRIYGDGFSLCFIFLSKLLTMKMKTDCI